MRTVYIYQNRKRFDRNLNEMKEVKDGELFGVVLRRNDIYTVSPQITINSENKVNYNLLLEINNELNVRLGTLPLILMKITNGMAQDILTGNIFAFGNWNTVRRSFLDIDGDIEKFQHAISKISYNKLIIDTQDQKNLDREIYYEVDGSFIEIYREFTLSHKQEVIDAINSLTVKTRTAYDEKIQYEIDYLYGIVDIEKMIFDIEKQKVKIKK